MFSDWVHWNLLWPVSAGINARKVRVFIYSPCQLNKKLCCFSISYDSMSLTDHQVRQRLPHHAAMKPMTAAGGRLLSTASASTGRQ